MRTRQIFSLIFAPILAFCMNSNAQAVDDNLSTLNSAGLLSADLASVFQTINQLPTAAAAESAFDQLQPATMSAFAELQGELGGQLLTLFHHKPTLSCGCVRSGRLWVEPFGNWLHEKHKNQQTGFRATTRGIAFGVDEQFFDVWTVGAGGAWQTTDLTWSSERGHAYTSTLVGSFYTDLNFGNFYCGGAAYAGRGWYDTARHILFGTIDRKAEAHYHGIDVGGQFATAYYFGAPAGGLFYPYAVADYLYLQNDSFSESGANSLDLNVSGYNNSTLRTEAGFALQIIDKNYKETICVSPLVACGWAMELPLHRSHYTSNFTGEALSFASSGWNQTWQLFNLRFGLGLTYRCLTIDSQYILDVSTGGGGPFTNQRANFMFVLNF